MTPMAIFLGYALPITLGVAGGVGAKKFKFFVDQKVPNPVLRGSLKVGVGAVGIGGLSVLFYFLGQNQKSLGYTSQHILDGLYLSSCVDMNIFLEKIKRLDESAALLRKSLQKEREILVQKVNLRSEK